MRVRSGPVAQAQAGRYSRGMSDSDIPLREQLDEAIERVSRELEILLAPSSIGGPPDNRSLIADLEAELQALKEARANVGPLQT